MLIRPADASGDVLPVLSSSGLLSGPEAVALLVRDRLSLLAGEWWENPALGFRILEELRAARPAEADAPAFASMITAYIRETPGVRDAEDVQFSVSVRRLLYSCTVRTDGGEASVEFEGNL